MTSDLNLILTAPPAQTKDALAFGVPVAHMAYRLGVGPRLLRGSIPPSLRGGLLMMGDQGYPARPGNPTLFCQQVLRECASRGYCGVVADWENRPSPGQIALTQALEESLSSRGWPLYVTEGYGRHTRRTRVLISSAISGGSLAHRLREAGEAFGMERVALAVERSGEDFTLPARSGCGRRLTPAELHALAEEQHAPSYFSPDLCARYFTYRPTGESGVHFVLYDDGESIRKKLELARGLGVPYAVMAYPQVADLLPDVLR
jgi:hypothetical protein